MNFHKSLTNASRSFALALAVIALSSVAQESAEEQTIDCAVQTGDLRSDYHRCEGFNLRYGDSKEISADLAIAKTLEFRRGEVQFVGNLRIRIDSALLTTDTATSITLADELESFELIGNPVVMSDVIEASGSPVRAEASMLSYDRESNAVIMRGDVRFAYGTAGNEVTTCFLRYELATQQFELGMPRECGSSVSLDRVTAEEVDDEQSDGP